MMSMYGQLHLHGTYTQYVCPGPCYYVGNGQGGITGLLEDEDSVIEGQYSDYVVDGLFGHNFIYSQFEEDRCVIVSSN